MEVLAEPLDKKNKPKDTHWEGWGQAIHVCRWHDCVRNQKTPLKLWELMSLLRLQNIKATTQKSIACEYTNNFMAEKELVRSVLFWIATGKIKYFGIN